MSGFINTWMAGVNEIGRGFCNYTAGMFVQSGVLIVALLLIDLVLRRRIRATVRYWIWMLVFIKLALPPSLSLPTGIGYWCGVRVPLSPEIPMPAAEAMAPEVVHSGVVSLAPVETPMSWRPDLGGVVGEPVVLAPAFPEQPIFHEHLTWPAILFLLWGAGVVVLVALVLQRLLFVRRLTARGSSAPGEVLATLDECRRQMGIRQQVGLKLSPGTFSPAVCGLVRPTILMPALLPKKLAPRKLKTILMHELAHVRRADLWINSLQTVLQIIYFYNPLVWLAQAIVRRVREQAVDEMVLVALGAEAGSYSSTLIDVAEMALGRAHPALSLVGVAESKKSLEERIRHMITRPIPKTARVGLAGCVAVLVAAAVLLPMARGQSSAPTAGDVSQGEPATSIDSPDPASQNETEAQELLKISDAYCRQHKYAEACGIYRHLLDKYPGADCARTARGSLVLAAAMLGDEPALQAALDGLLTGLPNNERLCQQMLQVAEDLRLRFKYDPARRLYQRVIDTWTQTPEADSARMGLVDVEVGPLVPTQDKAALQATIETLVAQYQGNPYLPRTIDRIGDLCAHGKRYEEAEATYRKVIVLAGPDAERAADAQMAIAWLYYKRARYEEALREYTKVVQDYPKTKMTAGGQYWVGQCYLALGDLEQAAEAYKKTIELYPGDIYAGHAEKQLALIDRRKEITAANAKRREAMQSMLKQRSSQTTETPRPPEVRPAPNLSTADYEARLAEILQRFSAAVARAYQDVGLNKQEVESLFSVQQRPQADDQMKAYGQSWPAILKARQTAIEEMVALGPGAVPILLRGRDNSGERRVGDLFVPAIVSMGAPAVPAVVAGLSSEDAAVRIRAANALRDLHDGRTVEPLLRALGDSDRLVVIGAVQALGTIADPRAVEPLLALWNTQDRELRASVALALGTNLHEKRIVEPTLAVLRDWMATARRTGDWNLDSSLMPYYTGALARIGDPRAIPVLEEMLSAGPQKTKALPLYLVASEAAGALRDLGCEVVGNRETGGYKLVRRPTPNASDAQGQTSLPPSAETRGREESPAVDQIAPAAGHSGADCESRVAEIMQRFATAVEQAYQDVGLTKQRVESLMSVQRQVPDETEEMKAYQRSWPAILQARQAAIKEMASLGPEAVPALLRGRDNSGDRRVGNMFSPAIAAMGAPAVPAVLEGLSKGNQPVRVRAIAALRELRDPRGVEPLLTALRDSDRIVRISAIQALDALADPRVADALLALWSRGDSETRVHLAAALGRLRDKRAIEPIATALREWMVASRRTGIWPANIWGIYVEALRQIGDPRVIPVLEEVLQAGPQKTKSGSAVYMIADAAAEALRGLGCKVIGDREKGGYAVVRRPGAIASDTQEQALGEPVEEPLMPNQPGTGPGPSAGQTVGGLRSWVVCAAREIHVGEPVVVTLWWENVSQQEITYYDFRKGGDEPSVITVLVDGKPVRGYTTLDTTGYLGVLSPEGINIALQGTEVRWGSPPVPREAFQTLKPGERVAYLRRIDLGTVQWRSETRKGVPGPLRMPGEHTIQIECKNQRNGGQYGLSAWTGTLRSNLVTVTIVGKSETPAPQILQRQIPHPAQDYEAAPNPGVGEYESRIAEVLRRLSGAVDKAYQDAGLTKQEVDGLLYRARITDPEKMKAYQKSWPALDDAHQAAVEELAALGPGAVPVLLRAKDTSGERRGGDLFASAIRRIGAPAVPATIEGLASPDRMVRLRAANSLCEIRDRRAVEPLIRALADTDRGVLIAVIGALGAFADPRAANPLLSLWDKAEDVIRPQLAWALAAIGERRAVEPIMGALQERLSAAKQAGSWKVDSWLMRRYAEALGQLRDVRAIPLLKELLHTAPQKTKADRDISLMAEAVAGALRRLGCQVTGDVEKGYQITEGPAPESSNRQTLPQTRDWEAAKTVPQPLEQWLTRGGNPHSWQTLQTDGKRSYPVTLFWPLIRGAGKYVVHVKGLRGSRPTRTFEVAANSLRLEKKDLEPGRYQWSVSVYDERGKYLGDVDTIDPVEVFAVGDPRAVPPGAKRILIDLNHSAGSIAGWGWDNHGQYMTKELLESIGCEVRVNTRDLLTAEKLRSTDLLICHYYWAGWPGFRPYLESELAAVYQFVADGGSLLVVGCDRTDGGGKMTPAGNQLVQGFGLRFRLDEKASRDGWAQVLPGQSILSVNQRIQVQLPIGVEGEGSIPLLQFQGVPIARAKQFGKGKIIVAGVGMSFLDCYLGDFELREPVHTIMFYDFIKYLTGGELPYVEDRGSSRPLSQVD